MKTKNLSVLLFGVILLIACQHSIDENPIFSESLVLQTRSITQSVSPWFDWEDTTIIASPFHGNILLPWYNTASVQLPDFILKDYKNQILI